MKLEIGHFYDIVWQNKTYKHCELLEFIPDTKLVAVRTPKYEYFEINSDFLIPEAEIEDIKPTTVHLDQPLKTTTIVNGENFNDIKEKAMKYEKYKELINFKIAECDRVLTDEYALKKEILKATTIKNAFLEIQNLVNKD